MNSPQHWLIVSIPDGEARQTQSREVATAYSRDPDCIVIDPLYWERILPDGKRVPLVEQTWVGGSPA